MCTLAELNTTLTTEDALDLIECWQVAAFNKAKLDHIAEQERKLRGNNG